MLYIGIDTGTHTGFAVWDSRDRCFIEISDYPIHRAMQKVEYYNTLAQEKGTSICVRVEDPRLREWFGERISRELERKKLQGVGSVKRDASIWEDYLRDLGVKFEMVAPKNNMTKLSKETFEIMTKWKGKTNEHKRDAAMMVFGK